MSENEYSPQDIFDAIARGDLNVVSEYLRQGGDPNIRNEKGLTLLHVAANLGKYEIAEELLKEGADPDAEAPETRFTSLHFTVFNEDADMTHLLLKYNASPFKKDYRGKTPLDYASELGLVQIIDVFMDFGINPGIVSDDFSTPLEKFYNRIMKTLKKMILNLNPNGKDEMGRTILHHLASRCESDLLELVILMKDVDVNARDNAGDTALNLASENHLESEVQCLKTVKVLLKYGANPLIRNDKGETPLDLARRAERFEIVKLLLKAMKRGDLSQEV